MLFFLFYGRRYRKHFKNKKGEEELHHPGVGLPRFGVFFREGGGEGGEEERENLASAPCLGDALASFFRSSSLLVS